MKKVLRASGHMAVQTRKESKRSQMQQKCLMGINASIFFPYNYRISIFTSLNVGPDLLKSAQHKHIPKVNCMHNGFAVWDQFCKQFSPSLSGSAWGMWPISHCSCHQHPLCLVWESILIDGQSYVLARACLSPPTPVSLGSCTSNFHCHLDA